jgi:hypothetical protein
MLMPLSFGSGSQEISVLLECSKRNTWSSLLQCLVTSCLCIRILLGSINSSPASATTSISFLAASVASFVKSCVSSGLSHKGWCLLKSPSHIMCASLHGVHSRASLFLWWYSISRLNVSSHSLLLYILNTVTFSHWLVICVTVTLLEGNSNWF